jgi:hypothetical protein
MWLSYKCWILVNVCCFTVKLHSKYSSFCHPLDCVAWDDCTTCPPPPSYTLSRSQWYSMQYYNTQLYIKQTWSWSFSLLREFQVLKLTDTICSDHEESEYVNSLHVSGRIRSLFCACVTVPQMHTWQHSSNSSDTVVF